MRFLDRERVLDNIRLATVCLDGLPSDAVVSKSQFIQAMNTAQDSAIKTAGENILIEFGNDELVASLVRRDVLSVKDVAGGRHVFSPAEQRELREKVNSGLELIRKASPGLCSLIESLIGSVAMYRVDDKTGGTISCYIGLIWLSPKADWSSDHFAELLVHESVHNSLFLEDMVHGLFPDLELLEDRDALVTSTIRGTLRGYDKSYHSACVAAALMYFYHRLDNEAAVNSYDVPLRKTVEELESRRDNLLSQGKEVITENGAEITRELADFLSNRPYPSIAARLGDT